MITMKTWEKTRGKKLAETYGESFVLGQYAREWRSVDDAIDASIQKEHRVLDALERAKGIKDKRKAKDEIDAELAPGMEHILKPFELTMANSGKKLDQLPRYYGRSPHEFAILLGAAIEGLRLALKAASDYRWRDLRV